VVSLRAWAKSDCGRKRAQNEDSYFINIEHGIFIIADGMGGHKGGDKASSLAVSTMAFEFLASVNKSMDTALILEEAMSKAAIAVYEAQCEEPQLLGMGTTLSALAFGEKYAFISHIGDTRVYCIRDHYLHQLTSDHSLVNEHIQAGIMSAEEARISSLRNIITRVIGHNKYIKPDHCSLEIKDKDLFLLCSDGLNNMLHDEEIIYIINNYSPEKVADILIEAANNKGGEDNISVIIIQIG
jgi:protein phosphatase